MPQATVHLGLTTNARSVEKALFWLQRSQLPFATAVALTRTAQEARDDVRQRMRRTFTIRSKRPVTGVQIKAARKGMRPIRSEVGTKDAFMAEHALGATRKAFKARRIAIPMRFMSKLRTRRGKFRKGDQPRGILSRKGASVADTPIGPTILRPRGRGRTKPLRRTFFLRRSIKIAATWPFEKQVRTSARRSYASHFRREFAAAVRTARRRVKRRRAA